MPVKTYINHNIKRKPEQLNIIKRRQDPLYFPKMSQLFTALMDVKFHLEDFKNFVEILMKTNILLLIDFILGMNVLVNVLITPKLWLITVKLWVEQDKRLLLKIIL